MKALDSGTSSHDSPNNVATQNDLPTTQDQDTAPSGNQPTVQGQVTEASHWIKTQLSNEVSPTVRSPVTHAMLWPLEAIAAMDSGVEAFFSYTGCIFHIYDQDEAHRLLSVTRLHIRDAGANWPQFFFRDSTPIQLKVSLCSVCIMATIGLQCIKNAILAMRFELSAENKLYRYVTAFHEITKHLMEGSIASDALGTMKVYAALCIFHSIGHTKVALAYAGTWRVPRKTAMF
jgi:hypothetical protein